MTINYPPWIKPALPVTDADKKRLEPLMANWVKLFAARQSLGELDCLKIIAIELAGRKRPEIVGRVRIWFCKRRESRELEELWKLHPHAGVGHQGRVNA